MDVFTNFSGIVAPLDYANVDTDAIIPKQYMKSVNKSGLGKYLFDEWRYEDIGEPGMDCEGRPHRAGFVLNRPEYADAKVLLARENFGCGSSREHAVWALADFGITVIVAPSFGDIFFSNCTRNGILPIRLTAEEIGQLFRLVDEHPGIHASVDLSHQIFTTGKGNNYCFALPGRAKQLLMHGGDEIGMTLSLSAHIGNYERSRAFREPWMF